MEMVSFALFISLMSDEMAKTLRDSDLLRWTGLK